MSVLHLSEPALIDNRIILWKGLYGPRCIALLCTLSGPLFNNRAYLYPCFQQHPKMSYIDLLVVGMKKEEISRKLYTDLATIAQTQELRDIFLKLAQEEAKHKLRFEIEYDLMTF